MKERESIRPGEGLELEGRSEHCQAWFAGFRCMGRHGGDGPAGAGPTRAGPAGAGPAGRGSGCPGRAHTSVSERTECEMPREPQEETWFGRAPVLPRIPEQGSVLEAGGCESPL